MLSFNNQSLNIISGIFVFLLLLFFLILFFAKKNNENTFDYYVRVNSIEGINLGSDIYFNGYSVGKVIGFNLEDINKPLLEIKISEIELTKDTIFNIQSVSFLGPERQIRLVLGFEDVAKKGYVFSSQSGLDLYDIMNLLEIYFN